jgi:hypothetical protein
MPTRLYPVESLATVLYVSHEFRDIFQPVMYEHVSLFSFRRAISFFETVSEDCNAHLARSVQTLQFSFALNGDPAEATDNDTDDDTDDESGASDESGAVDQELHDVAEIRREERAQEEEQMTVDSAGDVNTPADVDHSQTSSPEDSDNSYVFESDLSIQDGVVADFWAALQRAMPKLVNLTTLSISYAHDDPCFLRFITHGWLESTLPPGLIKLHLKPLPHDYAMHPDACSY